MAKQRLNEESRWEAEKTARNERKIEMEVLKLKADKGEDWWKKSGK